MVIVYNLNALSEQEFQRLLDAEHLGYVLIQVGDGGSSDEALKQHPDFIQLRERLTRLKQAGKKPVLQLFWGSPRWSWEIFSLANIGLDARVQGDFFEHLVGPLLEAVGPENVHGIHLLEENGQLHGSDAQKQLSPDCGSLATDYSWSTHVACSDCLSRPVDSQGQSCSAACWSQHSVTVVPGHHGEVPEASRPAYLQCLQSCQAGCQSACQGVERLHDGFMYRSHVDYNPRWFNDVPAEWFRDDYLAMCNVKRHEADFRNFTTSSFLPDGCTFEGNTEPLCMQYNPTTFQHAPQANATLVWRWVGNRLLAEADRALGRFVHQRYPGVKVFSWPDPFREDVSLIAQDVDGFIFDQYGYELAYRMGRLFKTVAPDKELLYLGGIALKDYKHSAPEKRSLGALGALMGAHGVGFFEAAHSFSDATVAAAPEQWQDTLSVFNALGRVPVLQPDNKVLLVADYASALRSDAVTIDAFKAFDYVTPRELNHVDLSRYELIVLFNPDYWRERRCEDGSDTCLAHGDAWTWDSAWMKERYPGYGDNLDEQRLDTFIRQGGLVALIGFWPYGTVRPAFTRDYFALYAMSHYAGPEARLERLLTPSPWAEQHFGMSTQDTYLAFQRNSDIVPGDKWSAVSLLATPADPYDDTGGFHYRHGHGGVLVVPSTRFPHFGPCDNGYCSRSAPFEDTVYTYDKDYRGYLSGWRRYVRDALWGMVRHHQRTDLEPFFNVKSGRDVAHYEQHFSLPRGRTLDVLSISYRPVEPTGRSGVDLFTGVANPSFTLETGGLLVERALPSVSK
jgi:hypothetical protein